MVLLAAGFITGTVWLRWNDARRTSAPTDSQSPPWANDATTDIDVHAGAVLRRRTPVESKNRRLSALLNLSQREMKREL